MDDIACGKAASVIPRGRIKVWLHGKFAPLRGGAAGFRPERRRLGLKRVPIVAGVKVRNRHAAAALVGQRHPR